MSGRGRGRSGGPAFSGRTGGGRITSLQARDAAPGGGRGKKWKKPLNGNYMSNRDGAQSSANNDENNYKLAQAKAEDALEAELGFPLFTVGDDKLGWLMNMQPTCMQDKDSGQTASAVDCYFMCQDGSMFKARMPFAPYFYIHVTPGCEFEVEGSLRKKFEGIVRDITLVDKEDLDLKNHLSGLKRKLLRLSFWNVSQLMEAKKEVAPAIARNKARAKTTQAYADMALQPGGNNAKDVMDHLLDMREYDVPYHVRFAIDLDIRCGHWFTVSCQEGHTVMTRRTDLLQRAEPRICAWDIETTKLPLQFPNAEYDQVFMISYMIDRQGYLITNREVVGDDISDFEFSPKPEFEGPFLIFKEANERALLTRFFDHMREVKPAVYVTYNGDFFDFPFVEKRAAVHGMNLYEQLGFKISASGEVLARHAVHMDCLHWVNRDSYLPQGSRGLKAVTKAKLGYDPVEVNPEDMLTMAAEQPQAMASYSVSDAVSTYYLYMTYIHPFIFSLATIIPMPPDEVLRKGSGTLCEQLLMVQAFQKNIVCPNKHTSQAETFYKGHLLDSETYIGGKVEAIESGVFRADLPLKFRCNAQAYQSLIDRLDKDLGYAIVHEGRMKLEDITNYEEVKAAITEKLAAICENPNREECPMIYHLDVAAMYPNIILTNRLQPSAIVTDEDCAACDFNLPGKTCLRSMEWVWRGEHFAATRNEYFAIKNQLQAETFPALPVSAGAIAAAAARGQAPPQPQPRSWEELSLEEKDKLLKDRLKKYTQKVYKRVLDKPITEHRQAGICQRENDFYVDTVRAFRDRRYEYKGLNKTWKGKLDAAKAEGAPIKIQEASDMVVLFDSLQLAHKCILNSFYGYVMRKGARWYSMEMAGVVTYTGANIIQRANKLIGALGRPLELDTDGIWCTLPASFPENYKFKNKNGKEHKICYPGVMLNVMVADHNTNPQYATLTDPEKKTYTISSEMSIEFEVDGPYKAMILPASKEEGKSIKKRYAVFNFDGSLAELKGFEMKRRGELKLIKVFQAEVFERFLEGSTLSQCYAAVAAVANRWLDMLDTQGTDLTDEELIEYISEATTMSKGLEEYEGRKSSAITCAKRLGQFLGDERIKDKGLNCQYVIARKPESSPTSERTIPVSIFSAEPAVARTYLRQWCGDIGSAPANCVPNVRDIVDWDYYKERLGGAIQKIITIPAALQGIANPCVRVKHPDWLQRKVAALSSRSYQQSLTAMLPKITAAKQLAKNTDIDMEDVLARVPSNTLPAAQQSEAAAAAGQVHTNKQLSKRKSASPDNSNQENADPNHGEVAPVADVPKVKPPLPDGYKAWMQAQKDQWRQARANVKRRRLEAAKAAGQNTTPGVALPQRVDVGSMLRHQAAAITAVPWHVLQLAETATPGRFKLWFLATNQVHHVHLRLPRVFYVDSEEPLDISAVTAHALGAAAGNNMPGGVTQTQVGGAAPGTQLAEVLGGLRDAECVRAASKTLPGGRQAKNLYKVTMSEQQYLAHVPVLSAVLSAPHIRAVYEERLPLSLAALLKLGCVAKLTPAAVSHALNQDFHLSDFQGLVPGDASSYLTTHVAKAPVLLGMHARKQPAAQNNADANNTDVLGPHLKFLVLYGSGDTNQGRALYCLFSPTTGKCTMVVIQPSNAASREVTTAGLDRAWREAVANMQGVTPAPPQRAEFSVEYCTDTLDAGRVLLRALSSHRAEHRNRALVVVQGPQTSGALAAAWLPVLADCPCVDLQPHADDSRYPALQWQARAARRALHRVLDAGVALAERVQLARYASVPVANLGGDTIVSVADLQLARALRASDHVLWVKDWTAPDLGVEDKDDGDAQLSCMVAGLGATISDPTPTAGTSKTSYTMAQGSFNNPNPRVGGSATPELLAPGAYRSVCCELKLHHLAVAALLEAATLGDLEGAASVEGAGGPAGPAFKVLKTLVASWLNDATNNMSQIADFLLRSLYRWVSWPGSALYDPALQRALQGVMGKLFAQLVSEMRKLGAVLIHANFSTIIIATGKRNMPAAVGYVRYLTEALRRRELFGWIELAPQAWWHALLFRDPYNWGGIAADPDQTEAIPKEITGDKHNQTQPPTTPSRLGAGRPASNVEELEAGFPTPQVRISSQQVPAATLSFQWSLASFLPPALQEELELLFNQFLYLPWREANKAAAAAAAAQVNEQGEPQAVDESQQRDIQQKYLEQALSTTLTQQLLQVVGEAAKEMAVGSEQPEHQFPVRAGSHLTQEELGSPALAFVRAACHVLALDTSCSDAVAVLRRQLLRLLHVREFSAQADFQEMCLALTLPDVICTYCNDCRDLDLCRDADLAAQGSSGTGWTCRSCSQHYDMQAMERRLVAALQQHVRDYQLQDLQCTRCRAVASSHLKGACSRCGGQLSTSTSEALFRKRLTVFHSVARHHGFEVLQQLAAWLLEH